MPTAAPDYPFQRVTADMFEIKGKHYMACVDHLTGFAELAYYSAPPNSSCIINTLRKFFHRWVAAEEISLDGGLTLIQMKLTHGLKLGG